eukprot:3515216-Amphidinium_carterae.1
MTMSTAHMALTRTFGNSPLEHFPRNVGQQYEKTDPTKRASIENVHEHIFDSKPSRGKLHITKLHNFH